VKLILWALGEKDVSKELENCLRSNEHVLLIEDIEERKKYANYLNPDLIPNIYKTGKNYYNNVDKFKDSKLIEDNLRNNSILKKNQKIANIVKNLFNSDLSPGLVSDEVLKLLPKAYIVTVELDELKDESLIYAERLRRCGVEVKVEYYEDGFHGILTFLDNNSPNTVALKIVEDLIKYIKKNV
jgi:acetyl esterase/lipase